MLSKIYKLSFDISVCFAIGAFLLKFFGGISIYGGGYLTLLISALVSIILKQKQKLKILTIVLIPVVFLIFSLPKVPELVVFLLIWVYSSYISITEHYISRRGEFVDMLKRISYSCLLLPFLMMASFRNLGTALQTASPYLIAALVSAVFLLRHLRSDNQMEQMKRYRRQQFMELLAFLAVSLMLTLARAPQNLVEGLKLMYQHLLVPILSILVSIASMLISGIIYLIIAVVSFLSKNNEMAELKTQYGKTMRESIVITDAGVADVGWIINFMYSIGAIIGLVLLFFFFRWLMGEKMKQRIPTGIQETREYLTDVKDERAAFRKRRPKDSRAAVRYYYGKSLLWMQHKRVKLKPQDTAEEIDYKYSNLQAKNLETQREASAQLKQIYWKARYQMTEQITKEEAEEAKHLYQAICKKAK
jgi:hypothetical protein